MDVTYLQRAALAGAFVLPLGAVAATVTQDDSDDPVCCDGCGGAFAPDELTEDKPPGFQLLWCRGCLAADTTPATAFDCVQEDDGEP